MTREQDSAFTETLAAVRRAAGRRILFLPHAISQMARPSRMITTKDVRSVVEQGEVLEDYPEDARGYSCLMLGVGTEGRCLHVVCSPKADYLAIITAYLPSQEEWESDLRTRRT